MTESEDNSNLNENTFQWHLLKCRAGDEDNVMDKIREAINVHGLFQDNFIPMSEYRNKKSSKKQNVDKTFAGFFFLPIINNQKAKFILRNLRVSVIKQYTLDEVNEIVSKINNDIIRKVNKDFAIDEVVKVKGFGEGKVVSVNHEKQQVKLVVFVLNRYNTITVDFHDVEKIS